jgi:pseudaminic acid synthase
MVNKVRDTEKLLGTVSYEVSEKVKKNRKFARSLFVVKDVKAGEIITPDNVRSIRPGYGLHPKYYNKILGKSFSNNIIKGTPLNSQSIENFDLEL